MSVPSLPIIGAAVTQLRFDFAFSIIFDAPAEARIETAFSISDPVGHTDVIDPETDLGRMGSLLTLHKVKVLAAEADEAGNLRLQFADGRRLECPPRPAYEAWSFNSLNGLQIVALPGGGVAIWGGVPK